jgi:protein-S-isoprenylcysteine O-methyltransferase Ste14
MHPGYTALLMHILPFLHFIGLKHDLPVLALYTVIGIFPFSSRIINEEKYLEEHFGKVAFDKYKSERWHVIPYVI